jgi:hypothetical protein
MSAAIHDPDSEQLPSQLMMAFKAGFGRKLLNSNNLGN